MTSPFITDLMRRWQTGKKLNRRQSEELTRDGLLEAVDADNDFYAITDAGRTLLYRNRNTL